MGYETTKILFPLQIQALFIFGDSNVAGWRPDAPKLFGKTKTWPRRLEKALGLGFRVLVDGVPGRALENAPSSLSADLEYFSNFVGAGKPGLADTLVLMIGVNDLPLVGSGEAVVDLANTYIQKFKELAGNSEGFKGRVLYVLHPGII